MMKQGRRKAWLLFMMKYSLSMAWHISFMITSSNGNFSMLLTLCEGNSPVTGEFPTQRPVTWSFDVFFDLCLNKRLSKQSRCWRFQMPSHPLWCHCNAVEPYEPKDIHHYRTDSYSSFGIVDNIIDTVHCAGQRGLMIQKMLFVYWL